VTGSKGKGSTTVLTAKVLQHLGHTVGTITSPHLLHYCERFRINGVMMPEADFLRILNDLHPEIDRLIATLPEHDYLSPQGIFLAVGLRWFDENNVAVAVVEVGRGGRFDDNRLVKHKLSLFTPIFLEHTRYLGATLERIAWHKAGIIEPMSYAYSLPQDKSVLDVLQAEAEKQQAEFAWISQTDIGQFTRADDENQWFTLGRYGELQLSMLGRYEVDNATLAIWGAGNVHSRLGMESSPIVARHTCKPCTTRSRIFAGMGGCKNSRRAPSSMWMARSTFIRRTCSLKACGRSFVPPVVVVLAVPTDRDLIGVSNVYALSGRAHLHP
jgi:folylpolyglutamate synthase/dihydrofolate synthase